MLGVLPINRLRTQTRNIARCTDQLRGPCQECGINKPSLRPANRYKAIRISPACFLKCSGGNNVEPRLDHDLRQTVTKRTPGDPNVPRSLYTRKRKRRWRTHERSCWAQTDESPPHPRFSTYTRAPLPLTPHSLNPLARPTQTREARNSRRGQKVRVVLNEFFCRRRKEEG